MTSNRISLAALLLVAGLGGCAVAPDGDEPSSTTESALMNTGGGGASAGYTCSGGYCTCTGDPDCNDMFSDGVCGTGPKSSICHINEADVPRCRCSMARRIDSRPIVVAPVTPIVVAAP